MAAYKVVFDRDVEKDLAKLPKKATIIYSIDERFKEVIIYHIRHRKEVYRGF